ncbi:MAG: LPS export ABC transporter periplasmic protein LptC [Proteobacteria bacterium]|nr:LPS export ABC transporter periplasmic protein LptC [Pseudomonadota bacterium]
MNRRALATVLLMPVAVATAWWAWRLWPKPEVVGTVGPQRGDYTVERYHLVAMNKQGGVAFRSQGPYAVRDPFNQQLFLNTPRFSFPDHAGKGDWNGSAQSGWVSSDGDEVRLKRDVVLDGPVVPGKDQIHIRTQWLSVMPDPQTAHTPLPVSITRGPSILSGTGMNAWLPDSRVELLSKVSFHDVPKPKH